MSDAEWDEDTLPGTGQVPVLPEAKVSSRKCTDCGTAPVHRDSADKGFCRYCATKGGHRYLFETMIDHDLLRALVGDDVAEKVIRAARAT